MGRIPKPKKKEEPVEELSLIDQVFELISEFRAKCKNLNEKQLTELISKVGIVEARKCLSKPCARIIDCLMEKAQRKNNKDYNPDKPYPQTKI